MSGNKIYLQPPPVQPKRYQSNFIKTAVCELRFPTLLELETHPPTSFQGKIRKSYPFYEPILQQYVTGDMPPEHNYLFRSKDLKWTVAVKSASISLETSKYIDFEDFYKRLSEVLNYAKDMIDSDFFTRVGLRYINSIPIDNGSPEGWINSNLIQAISSNVLGTPKDFQSIVQGYLENGEYTLRQVLQESTDSTGQNYILDFDYHHENVEFSEVNGLIHKFHEINFSLFHWCLGPKAIAKLGKGKDK